MEESCFICGICEAGKDESGVLLCGCKGYIRYVAWGVCPAPKKRGRPPKITIHDVLRKIEELPYSDGLVAVAGALEVEERTVERVADHSQMARSPGGARCKGSLKEIASASNAARVLAVKG